MHATRSHHNTRPGTTYKTDLGTTIGRFLNGILGEGARDIDESGHAMSGRGILEAGKAIEMRHRVNRAYEAAVGTIPRHRPVEVLEGRLGPTGRTFVHYGTNPTDTTTPQMIYFVEQQPDNTYAVQTYWRHEGQPRAMNTRCVYSPTQGLIPAPGPMPTSEPINQDYVRGLTHQLEATEWQNMSASGRAAVPIPSLALPPVEPR